ncbi:MAG: hypothetical protein A2156_09585 [Deltaproteobacteria bacterium RBG_16_48_10]|nr:MAG: hypothetical protein A2156_09585 [Deltaproteobacteria bacterium RBG_16_48_10]
MISRETLFSAFLCASLLLTSLPIGMGRMDTPLILWSLTGKTPSFLSRRIKAILTAPTNEIKHFLCQPVTV